MFTFILASGEKQVGLSNFEKSPVSALVGQDGHVSTFPGHKVDAGAFEIPDVPEGPYLLKQGTLFVQTDARDVALGTTVLGRANVARPTGSTPVHVNVTNLDPLSSDDEVELSAMGVGFADFQFQNQLRGDGGSPAFAAGDSELHGSIEWFQHGPVVNSFSGDVLMLGQLAASDAGSGGAVQDLSLNKFLVLSGQSIPDGQPATLAGSMERVSPTGSVTASYQRAAALEADLGADAQFDSATIALGVLPGARSGVISGFPDLRIHRSRDPSVLAFDLSGAYGNPYPQAWDQVVTFSSRFLRTLTLDQRPGATLTVRVGLATRRMRAEALSGITNRTGPVRNLRVNGSPASQNTSAATVQPTLSWDLPATGSPGRLVINAYEVVYDSTAQHLSITANTFRAFLAGTSTSFQVPEGLLASGKTYYFMINAITSSSDDMAHAPQVYGQDFDEAYVTTHFVSP